MYEEYKQVIVVRSDLKMSKGKLAVQVAHASVDAVLKAINDKEWSTWVNKWVEQGMKKIVVRVENEERLLDIYNKCVSNKLPCSIIRDAGKTELPPGTLTAVGIGPAPSDLIDMISGDLPLL
ncbi:MAG: peptidyl-tRNA hydrolase [Desulfurococcales archaeon]|jgi:PTH2 family peptidyl-tRNA hydrolase|nr:peptidyl-tRNA hydrolase [Desulfurococcaceae archaeon]NAZ14241.1 peptidyl-tRNA hydrolase [Desulfurococcales archaeon]